MAWHIYGIGAAMSDVYPFLSPDKILARLFELGRVNKDDFDFSSWLLMSDAEKYQKLSGHSMYGLADILSGADENHRFTHSSDDKNENYFYYEPCFPWEVCGSEREFQTQEDAIRGAFDNIMKYARNDIKHEDVYRVIRTLHKGGNDIGGNSK